MAAEASHVSLIRVGAIINCNKKYLCVYQNESGYWGFPKGMLSEKKKQTPVKQTTSDKVISRQTIYTQMIAQKNLSYKSFASIIKENKTSSTGVFIKPELIPNINPDDFPLLAADDSDKNVINYQPLIKDLELKTKLKHESKDEQKMMESLKDGAIREVEEETGIKLNYRQLCENKLIITGDYYYFLVNLHHQPKTEINDNKEIGDIEWLTLEELGHLNISRQTRDTIMKICTL